MNQFDIFIATTECLRSDTIRALRRLRMLDDKIHRNMQTMRQIVDDIKQLQQVPKRGVRGGKRLRDDSADRTTAENEVAELLGRYQRCKSRVETVSSLRVVTGIELANTVEDINRAIALRMAHFSRSIV